jgi:hypothetical protein
MHRIGGRVSGFDRIGHDGFTCSRQGQSELEGQGLSENTFDPGDVDKMMQRLEALRTRHRELDELISQLEADGGHDIRIMGLKRDKLRTKDHITWLSSKLTPDIIA